MPTGSTGKYLIGMNYDKLTIKAQEALQEASSLAQKNDQTQVELEHILLALKLLDSGPHEAAMVGDHPMDIRIGKDVGACTVGVLTGYAAADALLEAGADLVIERATHIVRYLP